MDSRVRNDGKAFEVYALRHHLAVYGGMGWPMGHAPVEALHAARFIHSYNEDRLRRIARARALAGKTADLVSDYGMDMLLKMGETYHAGQAKNFTKRKVTARDIGTFLQLCFFRMRTTGYLYTTTNLEINLREDMAKIKGEGTNEMIHEKLVGFTNGGQQQAAPAETRLVPYPVQVRAIEAMCAPGAPNRMLLIMPCGTGKTLVAGRVLEIRKPRRIVCIAPLLVSVKNLHDRLQAFLSGYRVLLVDSDAGGTTDPDFVEMAWKGDAPLVVFSTFHSAANVLINVSGIADAFLVVDEAHNMLGLESLGVFYLMFEHSLLMSATVPAELRTWLEIEPTFHYTFAEAIRDEHVCDYEIVLPEITYDPVEEEDDDGVVYHGRGRVEAGPGAGAFDVLPEDLVAKAMFLMSGMLRFGSRRCIAYLPLREDCDAIMPVLVRVGLEHYGMRMWTGKIDGFTGAARREQLLREFEADDERYDIWVMASVRVLDEAIDVPRCDSTFVAHVGDSASKIRAYQRMMRGCRLDPSNPSKRNHMFVWTDDLKPVIGMLSLLRQADPEFSKKIRMVSLDYDRNGQADADDAMRHAEEDARRYVDVKCMTLDE